MCARKVYTEGRRINIWVPPAQREMAEDIANLSKFIQICLDNAPDIMSWAILKEVKPKKYYSLHTKEEVLDDFNEKYPLDPLTRRRKPWRNNSQKLPDVLS